MARNIINYEENLECQSLFFKAFLSFGNKTLVEPFQEQGTHHLSLLTVVPEHGQAIFGLVFKGLGIVCSLVEAWLDHMICYVDT